MKTQAVAIPSGVILDCCGPAARPFLANRDKFKKICEEGQYIIYGPKAYRETDILYVPFSSKSSPEESDLIKEAIYKKNWKMYRE